VVPNESERALLKRVRDFTESAIAPVIESYWSRDAFAFEIIPKMADVGIRDTTLPAATGS
jgi:glutaryl-CoA dehydrogenase